MEPLLDIQQACIERRARRGEPRYHLNIEHLQLYAGERLGIIGQSGSGKSTLLDFVALLTWPQSLGGFQLLDAVGNKHSLTHLVRQRRSDLLTDARAQGIGYLVQNGSLLPYLSVTGNAMLAADLAKQPLGESRRRLARFSERLGIAQLLHQPPAKLSGGERQRAAMLRMLMTGARVLVADEPTASLDDDNSQQLMELLIETAKEIGAGVICASHDHSLLRSLGFRVLQVTKQMNADKTQYEGSLSEVPSA